MSRLEVHKAKRRDRSDTSEIARTCLEAALPDGALLRTRELTCSCVKRDTCDRWRSQFGLQVNISAT